MAFVPYLKIAEAVSAWGLGEAETRRLDRARWAVTEKLHGANLCVRVEGQRLRPAKRKALLAPGEDFFNAWDLIAALRPHVLALAEALRAEHGPVELSLYGELLGGRYPHPDVPAHPGLSPVQTGIWYCPDLRFCVFDLALHGPEGQRFLDLPELQARCDAAGLLVIETLAEGRLEEALAYPLPFESTLPARLGLPPLDHANLAEGVVVRPTQELVLRGRRGPLRPLIKRKIPAFAEAPLYHQGQAWALHAPDPGQRLEALERALLERLTPARVDAAISKQGLGFLHKPDAEDALLIELTEDTWSALEEAHGAWLDQVEAEDRALLRALLEDEARAAIARAAERRRGG